MGTQDDLNDSSQDEVKDDISNFTHLTAEPEVGIGYGVDGVATEQMPQDCSSRRASKHADQEEMVMQALQRRRVEARFKEVSSVHEENIIQMEAEQKEIERRMQKQQNWLKHIDEQVLKAEITKTKYRIRLKSAQMRVKSMGENLSKAYENMGLILEERMKVEDMATRNEAIVAYLHVIGQADAANAANFVENKEELLSLMETSRRAQHMRSYTEDLTDQAHHTSSLVSEAVRHTEDLQRLADQLHQVWNIIPVDWKDSVFKHVQKGLTSPLAMHPVNAIQAVQSASAAIHASQKQYLRALSELVPRHPSPLHISEGNKP